MMDCQKRKHIENSTAPTHLLSLRTAAYLRVSEAELVSPSESIENQAKVIEAFLDRWPHLILTSAYTDVDDRSFQREGFQQMIRAIESREIDCVIVKNLSDLGRNIIEIGYYVESYFPRNNIRLISISDQIEILDEMSNMHKQSFIFEPNNYMDQLRNVIVLLRYAVGKVDMQIERQRFLIESLRSSVEKEIINPAESEELHLTFMSKQTELMKLHDLLQEDIRRVMINP